MPRLGIVVLLIWIMALAATYRGYVTPTEALVLAAAITGAAYLLRRSFSA